MGLQFLDVHEPIESVADVFRKERLSGHSAANCLADVCADTHAQFAVAVARVDRSAVLKGSLPLGWTCDASSLQCRKLQHAIIVADKTLHRQLTAAAPRVRESN